MALSEAEQNRLIIDNVELVDRVIVEFRGQELGYDDIRQEAMVGLVQAARSYDPAKCKASFPVWAIVRIRGAIKNAIARYDGLEELPSDDQPICEYFGRAIHEDWEHLDASPEDIRLIYEEFRGREAAIKAAMLSLSPKVRKMIHAHFLRERPISLEQVAREQKMSYHAVNRAVYRAVKRMRDIVSAYNKNEEAMNAGLSRIDH